VEQSKTDATIQAMLIQTGQDSAEKQQLDQQQLLTQTLTQLLQQH